MELVERLILVAPIESLRRLDRELYFKLLTQLPSPDYFFPHCSGFYRRGCVLHTFYEDVKGLPSRYESTMTTVTLRGR